VSAIKDSAKVGVIGGSGFYELLENAREVAIDTPFGTPSDSYFLGDIDGGRSPSFLGTRAGIASGPARSTTAPTSGA
jgi:purine nucleoside phosphorylase